MKPRTQPVGMITLACSGTDSATLPQLKASLDRSTVEGITLSRTAPMSCPGSTDWWSVENWMSEHELEVISANRAGWARDGRRNVPRWNVIIGIVQ